MKKITANIQLIHEGVKQIVGYYTEIKLKTGEVAEVIIHKDLAYPDLNLWSVSEYATGVSITPNLSDYRVGKTRNSILNFVIEYVNRKLKENNTTLHEVKQSFLKSTNLNYVN
jgi:hypothetical protein